MSHRDGNPPPLAIPEFPDFRIRTDPPRILMLYGSLRERSYSRLLAEEAARVLEGLGCDVRFFHPHELPVKGPGLDDHPKVQELSGNEDAGLGEGTPSPWREPVGSC